MGWKHTAYINNSNHMRSKQQLDKDLKITYAVYPKALKRRRKRIMAIAKLLALIFKQDDIEW